MAAGERCGILFGPERTGLLNEHMALADTVLSVPLNPGLLLAQPGPGGADRRLRMVRRRAETPRAPRPHRPFAPARQDKLIRFFEHLEEELDRNGFMRNAEKRPSMVRNLRNLFQRAQCTEQELRTLRGSSPTWSSPCRARRQQGQGRAGRCGAAAEVNSPRDTEGTEAMRKPRRGVRQGRDRDLFYILLRALRGENCFLQAVAARLRTN